MRLAGFGQPPASGAEVSNRQSILQARDRSRSRVLASAAVWLAASCISLGVLAQDAPVDAPATRLTAPATPGARSSGPGDTLSEPALRQAWQSALWPADIARLAASCADRYPGQDLAAEAASQRDRAQRSAALLQQPTVQLFRRAFAVSAESGHEAPLLRRAALGDAAAALQLARQTAQAGEARLAHGWLQFASELGSDQATYALALHYRREAQPWLASHYEARAVALGFEPPTALNHLR